VDGDSGGAGAALDAAGGDDQAGVACGGAGLVGVAGCGGGLAGEGDPCQLSWEVGNPSGQASRLRAPAARAALTWAARSSSPMATIGVRQSAGRLASAAQPTRATDGPVARAAVRPAGLGSAITTCQPVADWTACRRESAVPGSSWARTTSGDLDGTGARATGLLPVLECGLSGPGGGARPVRRGEQWPGGGPSGRRSGENVHNSGRRPARRAAPTSGLWTAEFG
jgi:hypothetical protein